MSSVLLLETSHAAGDTVARPRTPDRRSAQIAIDFFREHAIINERFCRRRFLTLRRQAGSLDLLGSISLPHPLDRVR